MTHDEHDHEHAERHGGGSFRSWVAGFVVGGLAGLAASLLMAPQSGRETRELVRYKATQLRQAAEQTAQETKEKVGQMSDEAKTQVDTLRQKGMEYVDETKSRVNRVATAVTQAAKESWEEGTNGSHTPPMTPPASATPPGSVTPRASVTPPVPATPPTTHTPTKY